MATKKKTATKKTSAAQTSRKEVSAGKAKTIAKTTDAKKEEPVAEPTPVVEVQSESKPGNRKRALLISLVSLAVIALGVGGGLLYKAYNDQKERADKLANPTEAAKEETRNLIEKVSALTELPDEEPTIATVRDKSKLEDQSFFQNAQNGDKVLIFTQSKKAVLYRPSTDKIIEIAPVNLGQDQEGEPAIETNKRTKSAPTKPSD